MTVKYCSKCKDSFYTANIQDTLCCHCNGDMPRLTYWELEK